MMDPIKTDDPHDLDGYEKWANGGECPWFEIARGVYSNERTQQTFRWRPGQMGVLTPGESGGRLREVV